MNPLSKKMLAITATAALGACGLFAATTAQTGHMGRHGRWGQKMATELGLTEAQQSQAKGIFRSEREAAKPVVQQLRQERQAVRAAIRSGKSEQEVQQLAKAEGPQLSQLAALRADGFAKFYRILTPAQQQKLETVRQARMEKMREHREHRTTSAS